MEELQNWDIPLKSITKKYNVSRDLVRHINEGNSWKKEEIIYPIRPSELWINEQKALKVIDLLKNTTLTQKEIGLQVGWNRSAITMINIGKNHRQDNIEYPIRKKK